MNFVLCALVEKTGESLKYWLNRIQDLAQPMDDIALAIFKHPLVDQLLFEEDVVSFLEHGDFILTGKLILDLFSKCYFAKMQEICY